MPSYVLHLSPIVDLWAAGNAKENEAAFSRIKRQPGANVSH